MMATFGPEACADDKFSGWQPILHCVGLDFDLNRGLVSMPDSKIAKARTRVEDVLARLAVSRHELSKLLGSLRHVCSCIPSGRAFYQHLQVTFRRTYRFGRQRLSRADLDDLFWFRLILEHGRLHAIPTTLFAINSEPSIFLYMDASDDGLCVLDLGTRHYIVIQWDEEERGWIQRLNEHHAGGAKPHQRIRGKRAIADATDTSSIMVDYHMFTIDVREHLSGAFAVLLWGHLLGEAASATHTHIQFIGDNTTSVSWTNKLASSNLLGRNINRALALAQAKHNLHISERHLPGCRNLMADHGSRLSDPTHRAAWLRLSETWVETPVPYEIRYLYRRTWSQPLSGLPSNLLQPAATKRRSSNSLPSKARTGVTHGSRAAETNTPNAWWTGFWPPVPADGVRAVPRRPSDLDSAQLAGVIGPSAVSASI